jgi:sialic acid synthase SpsE
MKSIPFGSRKIGPNHPCFIIAEAGVNHNGSVDTAFELLKAARQAGADAVKFQTFVTEKLIMKGVAKAEYQKETTGGREDQAAMLKKLELGSEDFARLFAFAAQERIPIFSTPDETDSVDLLESFNVPAFKIGSGEITNLPLLRYIAARKRPVFLSTGMSTLAETAVAYETLLFGGARDIALLHCVSAYPAPFTSLNLRCLKMLEAAFNVPIGFSDHTLGTEAAIAAVAMGACIIEKHFTLDTSQSGPDHRCSLDPVEFARMVTQIRNVEAGFGVAQKFPETVEMPVRKVVRKGLVTIRPVKKGTCLSWDDVALKRVDGEALAPVDAEKAIGFPVLMNVPVDTLLTWSHLKKTEKEKEK